MTLLEQKHVLEEFIVFPTWLEANNIGRKKIVSILARKQADEIIKGVRAKYKPKHKD